jgi:LytS/YehU family sensor histidine kinase
LPLISIEREISICQHFIAIETIRYGNKLKLDIDCNPDALKYQVPPLCLQPLLENAIKHGISQLTTASPISLKVDVQHNKLYVLVGNDIPRDQSLQKPEGTQTGLENLRSRVTLLYGEDAYCGWTKSETHFQVELIFPLSESE